MKISLGPTSRLFVATAIGSFCGWFIVEPLVWSYRKAFDKKKDLPPPKNLKTIVDLIVSMKLTVSMWNEEAAPAKGKWRIAFQELRNPTTSLTRFTKYGMIIGCIGMVYYKFVKPELTEYKFRQREKLGKMLWEFEKTKE
ncbi:putative transporter [Frankliniella fusca]|uniref:Transporter n=1 Tax=Frankliniella fusca TaxID=407009 RepID=A0AAE1GUF4_9NEOP|nr:putative transporter [Frankliniella fusca]